MSEQLGWRGFVAAMRQEAPNWSLTLPRIPRLVHQALERNQTEAAQNFAEVVEESRRLRRWVILAVTLSIVLLGFEILRWAR